MTDTKNSDGMTPTEAVDLIMTDPEVQACLIKWHCNELAPQLAILDAVATALDPTLKRDPLQSVPNWGNDIQRHIGDRISELLSLSMQAQNATIEAIEICLADEPFNTGEPS